MPNIKHVITPTTQELKLSITKILSTEVERVYITRIPYASIMGSLMYVMVCTRPYAVYAVRLVSRYIKNPRKAH